MSTADSFISGENFSRSDLDRAQYRRWGGLSVPLGLANYDYVDVSIQDAYHLWFNLEDFEIVSSGTRGGTSVDWTFTFGATEAMPYTVSAGTKSRIGAYYTPSGNPAMNPKNRIFEASSGRTFISHRSDQSGGSGRIILQLFMGGSPSANTVRVLYQLAISNAASSTERFVISNPAGARWTPPNGTLLTGTPPSSGTISILGISLNWVGGGVNSTAWASDTATLSATSSAFTY